jgi:curved DNA-binding protein CbpA
VTDLDADAGGADPRDHYEVLGVARSAPPEVIRAAYLALAKRYHPDGVSPDAQRIRRINEAWRVLGRPSSRAEYDKALARAGRSESGRSEADDDAGGFSFGSAGWGEQDDGTTTLVEEVHDPVASGSPGWGDDFDGSGTAVGRRRR